MPFTNTLSSLLDLLQKSSRTPRGPGEEGGFNPQFDVGLSTPKTQTEPLPLTGPPTRETPVPEGYDFERYGGSLFAQPEKFSLSGLLSGLNSLLQRDDVLNLLAQAGVAFNPATKPIADALQTAIKGKRASAVVNKILGTQETPAAGTGASGPSVQTGQQLLGSENFSLFEQESAAPTPRPAGTSALADVTFPEIREENLPPEQTNISDLVGVFNPEYDYASKPLSELVKAPAKAPAAPTIEPAPKPAKVEPVEAPTEASPSLTSVFNPNWSKELTDRVSIAYNRIKGLGSMPELSNESPAALVRYLEQASPEVFSGLSQTDYNKLVKYLTENVATWRDLLR